MSFSCINVQEELDRLQFQLFAAEAEIERLRHQNEQMCDRIRTQSETISKAKDITPVSRPSFKRVLSIARAALLDITKIPKIDGGGWLLSMASLRRKFKSLRQIWDLLIVDD